MNGCGCTTPGLIAHLAKLRAERAVLEHEVPTDLRSSAEIVAALESRIHDRIVLAGKASRLALVDHAIESVMDELEERKAS